MEDYQERAIKERKELNEKIVKLTTFLFSEKVYSLDEVEKDQLHGQLHTMINYSTILFDRIVNFK